MAIVTGYSVSKNLNGDSSSSESATLEPIANPVDQKNYTQLKLDSHGTYSNNSPVGSSSRQVSGYGFVRSFKNDYYYRLHVTPAEIDAGNLLADVNQDVEIWNAFFNQKTLNELSVIGDSAITVDNAVTTPFGVAPLESLNLELRISAIGSPTIAAELSVVFNDQTVSVPITGTRVVVFPFMPQTQHKESLRWLTDIIATYSSEQRISLREYPRHELEYDYQLDNRQFAVMKAIANQWSHRVYGVPVWKEVQLSGDYSAGETVIVAVTGNRNFAAGSLAILWSDYTNFEAVEIASLSENSITTKEPLKRSYKQAYVAPLMLGRTLSGIRSVRSSTDIVKTRVVFSLSETREVDTNASEETYLDQPVITERTVLLNDITENIRRGVTVIDNGSGPIAVELEDNWLRQTKGVSFDALTLEGYANTVKLLYAIKGRLSSFWLPSWNNDITILANVAETDTSLTCDNIGCNLYYGVKDILIILTDGSRIIKRVTSSAAIDESSEVLLLDSQVGKNFNANEVELVTFLERVRLDSDNISFTHTIAGRSSAYTTAVVLPE